MCAATEHPHRVDDRLARLNAEQASLLVGQTGALAIRLTPAPSETAHAQSPNKSRERTVPVLIEITRSIPWFEVQSAQPGGASLSSTLRSDSPTPRRSRFTEVRVGLGRRLRQPVPRDGLSQISDLYDLFDFDRKRGV
jgi:hypothetical protein